MLIFPTADMYLLDCIWFGFKSLLKLWLDDYCWGTYSIMGWVLLYDILLNNGFCSRIYACTYIMIVTSCATSRSWTINFESILPEVFALSIVHWILRRITMNIGQILLGRNSPHIHDLGGSSVWGTSSWSQHSEKTSLVVVKGWFFFI